jgi:hypothetical protein
MQELIFEVTKEADGGFVAACLTESTSHRLRLGTSYAPT